MIGTVMQIGWLGLKRDRVAQALTFALPIAYFSIFAVIFSGMSGGQMSRVRLAVVDEDETAASARLVAALEDEGSLTVFTEQGDPPQRLTRQDARTLVSNGKVPVAVILRPGFSEKFGGFGMFAGQGEPHVDLYADTSNPIAHRIVMGLLQKAAMAALPDLMMDGGIDLLEQYGGPLSAGQRAAVQDWKRLLRNRVAPATTQPATQPTGTGDDAVAGEQEQSEDPFAFGLIRVNSEDLLASNPNKSPVNAFYAAAAGVLFLLFTTMNAAGVFIEEEKNSTLERLLTSRLTMGQLLIGRFFFVTLIGVAQLTVMFAWGALVFGVQLWSHLGGFFVITAATAAAAAGFGLVLATACRTRAQLDGFGTIVILLMSAIGGCMFPRFMMADWMQQVGLFTFNAWALDGYQKVFWYETALIELWPQVVVLLGLTGAFLIVARGFARRWEAV